MESKHLNLDIVEYCVIASPYLILLVITCGILFAVSAQFRVFVKTYTLWSVLPALLYAVLEGNFKHQDWNFIMVNIFLFIGFLVTVFLFFVSKPSVKYALIALNLLAILLWLTIPEAHMKLF